MAITQKRVPGNLYSCAVFEGRLAAKTDAGLNQSLGGKHAINALDPAGGWVRENAPAEFTEPGVINVSFLGNGAEASLALLKTGYRFLNKDAVHA
jgi:hypothetical protein